MASTVEEPVEFAAFSSDADKLAAAGQAAIASGLDINAVDGSGYTPLMHAVLDGSYDEAAWLLQLGANTNICEPATGLCPLHIAAELGNTDMTKLLLRHGALVDSMDDHQRSTALHFAAKRKHVDMVKLLLAHHATVDVKNTTGLVPMHAAAESGCIYTAQLLYERGGRLDTSAANGTTPLHIAAEKGHLALLQWMITSGGNVHKMDTSGRNALHYAVENGKEEVVLALFAYGAFLGERAANLAADAIVKGRSVIAMAILSVMEPVHCGVVLAAAAAQDTPIYFDTLMNSGADANEQDSRGRNALHIAVENGSLPAVELLLKHVSNPLALANAKDTVVHLAVRHRHLHLVQYFVKRGMKGEVAGDRSAVYVAAEIGFVEAFRLLFDASARGNIVESCLFIASQEGHLEIIEDIFSKLPRIDHHNAHRQTGMHLAAEKGHLEVVRAFISRGLPVDILGHGGTAFHEACRGNHVHVMRFLFESGANCNRALINGTTALSAAISMSQVQVVAELLRMGAHIERRVQGSTALQQAVAIGNLPIVRDILSRKPNLNAADANGRNPVVYTAVRRNDADIATLLLHAGAKADAIGDGGRTALGLAASKGCLEMVQLLVEAGACVQLVGADGLSPLVHAVKARAVHVVDYLVSVGATSIHDALSSAADSMSAHIVARLCRADGVPLIPVMRSLNDNTRWNSASYAMLTTLVASGYSLDLP